MRESLIENDGTELAEEHKMKVKAAVDMQKIVFKGEVLPGSKISSEQDPSAKEAAESGISSDVSQIDEIFFIYNGRDEREPHQFIKDDPLF